MSLTTILKALSKINTIIIKQKHEFIVTYNNNVNSIKETFNNTINTKIAEYKTFLTTSKPLTISSILSKLKELAIDLNVVAKTYTSALSTAELTKLKALADVVKTDISSKDKIKLAEIDNKIEVYKNKQLKINELNIDVGINEKNNIFSSINYSIPIDANRELYLKFTNAKVKLNSITELIRVINIINKALDFEDATTIRAWVHKIVKTHPLVDDAIKELTYFKPISEEVGSTYLLHTPDTQTLSLDDWSTDFPTPIRNLLKYKMDDTYYDKIHTIYYELNSAMARNISTEFFDGRKNVDNNFLGKDIYSNDYHIAGDYTFNLDHIGTEALKQSLMAALINYIGSAGKLINWLVPVNTYNTAVNSGVNITVEGNNVVVDLNGDKVGVIATIIDNKPITNVENE